jgi:predicted HTH transcriptional regulator
VRLEELLKGQEGKTFEFKRDLSSPEGILKCMVAFANTAGGIIIIGVEDATKHVRGVQDVLATEEKRKPNL